MKFQTFVFFLLINVYLCQNKPSVSIIDTYVTWQNLGTETEFTITSPLGGLNVNDAWIAVGVNDGPIMVFIFFKMKKLIINLVNHF